MGATLLTNKTGPFVSPPIMAPKNEALSFAVGGTGFSLNIEAALDENSTDFVPLRILTTPGNYLFPVGPSKYRLNLTSGTVSTVQTSSSRVEVQAREGAGGADYSASIAQASADSAAVRSSISNLALLALATKGQADGPQFVDGNRWTWATTGTANGGTIVAGSAGYWTRELSSLAPLTPEMFGAVGDGAADDTAPVQAAVTAAGLVNRSVYARKVYSITSMTNPLGVPVFGDGMTSSALKQRGTGIIMDVDSGSAAAQVSGFYMRDISLQGQVSTLGFSEFVHLLSLNGVTGALVQRVSFVGFRGDGLYIGSSNGGGATERHNTQVRIADCLFDGVNGDNRNGISVIDGDGITIEYSRFLRCTRATMPGPIDIEPDSAAFHVVRNITVRGNGFRNCGGNAGHIGVLLPLGQTALTTPARNFTIENNDIDGSAPASGQVTPNVGIEFVQRAAANITFPSGLNITGNRVKNVSRPFNIAGASTVRSRNNVFQAAVQTALVGSPDVAFPYPVLDFVSTHDSWISCVTDQPLTFCNGSDLTVNDPVFDSCVGSGAIYMQDSGITARVSIRRPVLRNAGSMAVVMTGGSTTSTTADNIFEPGYHPGAGVTFPYTKTASLPRSNVAQTVDLASSAAYANQFPTGLTYTSLNGCTNGPGAQTQGTLTTFIDPTYGADGLGFSYQIFNGRGTTGTIWIRTGNITANSAWGAWVNTTPSAATTTTTGTVLKAAAVSALSTAPSAAAPTQVEFNNLRSDFLDLEAKLRTAGVLT